MSRKLSDIQITPLWVLKAARANLYRTGRWVDYYHVLTAFYGIPPVEGVVVNPEIPKGLPTNTIAWYTHRTKTVSTAVPNMSEQTALHEFFHHLVDEVCGSFIPDREAEDRLADSFATTVLNLEP